MGKTIEDGEKRAEVVKPVKMLEAMKETECSDIGWSRMKTTYCSNLDKICYPFCSVVDILKIWSQIMAIS